MRGLFISAYRCCAVKPLEKQLRPHFFHFQKNFFSRSFRNVFFLVFVYVSIISHIHSVSRHRKTKDTIDFSFVRAAMHSDEQQRVL